MIPKITFTGAKEKFVKKIIDTSVPKEIAERYTSPFAAIGKPAEEIKDKTKVVIDKSLESFNASRKNINPIEPEPTSYKKIDFEG